MSIRSFRRAQARRADRERRRLATAKRRGALVLGAALGAGALMAPSAEATAYTVTTNGDGAGSCSAGSCTTLRAAVNQANTDGIADTISFADTVTSPITVGTPLDITDAGGITITGPGASNLAISGGSTSQIFNLAVPDTGSPEPQVSISNLKLEDGNAGSSGTGGAVNDFINDTTRTAPLILNNDVITGSTAQSGGGVYTHGSLSVSGSTLSGNTAIDVGGAIEATGQEGVGSEKYDITVTNSTITGNSAPFGGGIANTEDLTVTGSHITGNHATGTSGTRSGGGIVAYGGFLTLANSTVSGNSAHNEGGGIFALTKYGTTLVGSTISGNTADSAGGGLLLTGEIAQPYEFAKYNPETVLNSVITGNHSQLGAGVLVGTEAPGNPVTIQGSTLSGNQGGTNSWGGGVLFAYNIFAPVKLLDSTVSGNSAAHGGGVSLSFNGTGALTGEVRNRRGSIAIDNSTIAGNAATANGGGGGIYLGNYRETASGPKKHGVATLDSTIVSGNTAAGSPLDLSAGAGGTGGGFHAAFSLLQHPGNTAMLSKQSVIEGVNPQLGPLANNGGPTKTMLPAKTSPVIDQGSDPTSLSADQRGAARNIDLSFITNPLAGDGTDIGAVELGARGVVAPAGFAASVHGKKIGGSKPPVILGSSTPVSCTVKAGRLTSCLVEIRSSKGKLLANGEAIAAHGARKLKVTLSFTAAGSNALSHGVTGRARVLGNTSKSGDQTVSGKVRLHTKHKPKH